MAYRLPPIHCLVAFEAAARLGSLAAAARELYVTPSAVSHRIRQLEDGLGMRLFARGEREQRLTARGRDYLQSVRQALLALNAYPVSEAGRAARRAINLAVPATFARALLIERLPAFVERHPDVDVVMQVAIPLLDVTADEPDLEIRFGTGDYPRLAVTPLLDDRVLVVCSPDYRRRHGPFERPADLARASLLRCPLEPWRPWFAAAGLDWPEPRDGVQFSDLGLMMHAAAYGQGVALARQVLARNWFERGALQPLFDVSSVSPHAYYLVYHHHVAEREECAAFIAWLSEQRWDEPVLGPVVPPRVPLPLRDDRWGW